MILSKKNFICYKMSKKFLSTFNKIDNGRYKEFQITARHLKVGRIFLKKWLQDTKISSGLSGTALESL